MLSEWMLDKVDTFLEDSRGLSWSVSLTTTQNHTNYESLSSHHATTIRGMPITAAHWYNQMSNAMSVGVRLNRSAMSSCLGHHASL